MMKDVNMKCCSSHGASPGQIVDIVIFLRNLHAVIHTGYISLHSRNPHIKVPFSSDFHKHLDLVLLLLLLLLLLDDSHSNRGKVFLNSTDSEHLFMSLLAI